jgi:putative NIF3 family GTP cyclohydrolase 1 type 2
LAFTHHPEGKALADLHTVMELQAEVLAGYGVPINIAEQVIKPRISEVGRGVVSGNYNRNVDFAKIIKMNYFCMHTPCDNLGAKFLVDLIEKKKPEYVEDLLELIKEIPEYSEAAKLNAGPKLFAGSPDNHCGKIAVTEFTGGTSGSKDMFEKMSHYGIGTIIGMHMSEDHRKEAEKYHINVVIAGHMSSDSLGLNLFCDELEKKGIEIIPVSGFFRIKRI